MSDSVADVDPTSIQYLVFEGGGGKGVTYLGALQVLEELGITPIHRGGKTRLGQQIHGVAGSSAGAITALVVAMGYNVNDVTQLLSSTGKFQAFFEYTDSDRGVWRSANENQAGFYTFQRQTTVASAITGAIAVGAMLLDPLSINSSVSSQVSNPIWAAIIADPTKFADNMLYDRGLFTGRKVRTFFQELLDNGLARVGPAARKSYSGATITFGQFVDAFGIELVVTGANVSSMSPQIFSSVNTKNFLVAEAVAISMNVPVLFKPILVQGPENCKGLFVDGGLITNLPLHVFDGTYYPGSIDGKLNPGVCAFRLMDTPAKVRPEDATQGASGIDALFAYLAALFGTAFYGSEEGQIRGPVEMAQTIELWTGDLTLFDFTPTPDQRSGPIEEAHSVTLARLGQSKS